MTERAPTTTFNHEQSPKEQDPGAAFIDVARELRSAMNENPNSYDNPSDTGSDDAEDEGDMFEQEGVDGMYELLHHANEARRSGDADRPLKPYEQTLLDHMQTEVEFHKAQSHLDLGAMREPIDGIEDPVKHRIQEVVDKLRAEDDPANESKIGALETYLGFIDDDDSGHEARDFVMSHQVVEATPDKQSRILAEGFAAKATDDLRRVTDRNIISAEAYKALAEYYPGTPYDVSDLEDDPRLEYVPIAAEEEAVAPVDDTETVPIPATTPDAAPAAPSAKDIEEAEKASRDLDREIAESELAEARTMMAQAARGMFSKSSPELEALYAERKRTAGKMWLEDELKRRKIQNPTARQLTHLASLHAINEINSLTMATNAAMEKTTGRKFVDLFAKHPVLMGAGAATLLTLSGIGIPAAAAGTVGMILYSKYNRRFRGSMSGAEKTVSSTDLKNDMLVGSVDMGSGLVDRDLLFDSASEHMHDAYTSERHRQRLKNMGIPLSEVERYLKKYTRGAGSFALRGAGVRRPGSQSQYELAG